MKTHINDVGIPVVCLSLIKLTKHQDDDCHSLRFKSRVEKSIADWGIN